MVLIFLNMGDCLDRLLFLEHVTAKYHLVIKGRSTPDVLPKMIFAWFYWWPSLVKAIHKVADWLGAAAFEKKKRGQCGNQGDVVCAIYRF